MSNKKEVAKAVAVYLTDKEKQLLKNQAKEKGLSNSSYIRQIIFEYFKKEGVNHD